MYKKILFCLDNSEPAGYSVDIGLEIAKATKANVTGIHVYAAMLHDARFKLMEEGLPPAYQNADALSRQRKTHETLISKGLEIISESYLRTFAEQAQRQNITAAKINCEGKNYEEILKRANNDGFDLVALGANGLGRTDANRVGSVCERVVRGVSADTDVLVAKRPVRHDTGTGKTICVAIDGSEECYAALSKAVALSKIFNAKIDALSVYDVAYHQVAFKSLKGVLSAEAQSIFRFEDQQKLHEEIIDKGLERVYANFLNRAEKLCGAAGMAITKTLVADKPIDAICSHVKKTKPALLVIGRTGSHKTNSASIGSIAENAQREADCNILVCS